MRREAALVDRRRGERSFARRWWSCRAIEDEVVVEFEAVFLEQVVEAERDVGIEQDEQLAVVREILVERLDLDRRRRDGGPAMTTASASAGTSPLAARFRLSVSMFSSLSAGADEAVARRRLRVLDGVFAVALGEVDLGGLALDQRR